MRKCLECDFFVNKYTKPIRFKVVRRWHREGEIEKRLNAIMEHFEIELPEDSPAADKHNYIDADALKLVRDYSKNCKG